MQIRRVPAPGLAILLGVLCAGTVWPVHAQRNNNTQAKPTPDQFDIDQLYRTVDAVVAGTQPAPAEIPVKLLQHHMLMTQTGAVMIPYTLSIDRSKVTGPLIAYVRLVDKNAPQGAVMATGAPPAPPANNNNRNNRNQPAAPPVAAGPTFPVSQRIDIDVLPADGIVQRAIQVRPGNYELFIALKPKSTALPDPKVPVPPMQGGMLRQDLAVPDMSTGLGTSSMILASGVEPVQTPLTPQQQDTSPYTIGGVLKITPNITGTVAKAGEVVAVFWVYGVTSVQGKPDVTVEYSFHRKLPEGEKYFNRTEPQQYNAQSVAPNFNLDQGHQVMAVQGLSVQSFPAGDYRMEIKITDKPSGKSITRDVNFTVLPA